MLNQIIELFLNMIYSIFKVKQVIDASEEWGSPFYRHMKRLYYSHGAKWEEVNIFGLRDISNMDKDVWNDWICIATGGKVYKYQGTCDPSVYWTKAGGANKDKDGVAHICLGWYPKAYRVGFHGSGDYRHEALIQLGKIKIWRDGNNNFRQDATDIIQWGWFATNIHRAAKILLKKIGRYSAGCQVIRRIEDFLEFMKIIKLSQSYRKNPKYRFGYLLLNIAEIPQELLNEKQAA